MKDYSQNGEQLIIEKYFGQYVGTLLSIGENNGVDYSNVFSLIKNGWSGLLVEPSMKVFPKLCDLHFGNENIVCANVAIGDEIIDEAVLYDSGDFLLKGTCSLLSTCKPTEIKRWGNVTFEQTKCKMITFEKLMEDSPWKRFDLISVDAEGFDIEIMKQLDLDKLECRCIVLEHNSIPFVVHQMKEYVESFGLKQIAYNAENLIFTRP